MADDLIPVANEYDEVVRGMAAEKGQSLKHSFTAAAASGVAPDTQARVIELSRRHDLPTDIVARNLDTMERQEREAPPDLDMITARAPGLSRWLENPDNAALSNDDLDPLANIERSVRKITPDREDPSFPRAIGRAAATGWTDLNASAWHLAAIYGKIDPLIAAEHVAQANKHAAELRAKAPDYAVEFGQAMQAEGGDVNRAWRRFTGSYEAAKSGRILEALRDYHAGGIATIGQALDMIGAAVIRPRGLLHSTAENLAFSAPALALGSAGAAAGAYTGALAPIAVPVGMAAGSFAGAVPVEVGAWVAQEMAKRPGFDPTNPEHIAAAYADAPFMSEARAEAERKGIATASVDAVFNAFAGKFLAGAKGASRLARAGAAAADIGVQAAGETLSEAAGQAAAKKSIKGVDVGDAILEGIVSLGHSAAETAVGAAANRASFHVETAKAAQEVMGKTKDAMGAQRAAQALADVGLAVEASKTAKRLPSAIQEIVAAAAEGTDASTIYFQTEPWDTYWQGVGLSPVKAAADIMGDGGQAYTEAKSHGTQLGMRIEDYIGKVAQTEHYAALLPEARVKPDGMSLTEATEFLKGLPSLMDELAGEAVGKGRMATPEEAATKESGIKVRMAVTDMLIAAKTPRPEATRLGQLWERHMIARAERLGVDPFELFQKQGIEITRPTPQAHAETIVQALAAGDLKGLAQALTTIPAEPAISAEGTAIEPPAGDISFPFGENVPVPTEAIPQEAVDFLRDEDQLRREQIISETGGLTPVLDAIRANGGLDMQKLKATGRMGELKDLHWTQIFTTGGKTLDGMAEALHQEGVAVLKERDINLLVDKIREEAAAIVDYKAKYGEKSYQRVRRMLEQGPVNEPGGEGAPAPGEGLPGALGRLPGTEPPPGALPGPSQGLPATAPAGFLLPSGPSINPAIENVKARVDDWLAREAAAHGMEPGRKFTLQFATSAYFKDLNKLSSEMLIEAKKVPMAKREAFYAAHPGHIQAKELYAKLALIQEAYPDVMHEVPSLRADADKLLEGFKPLQARTLEQGEKPNAPAFFSKLARTLEAKMGNSATVEQVRAIIKETKGEEVKWSGLEEFLKGKEKVTKAEVMDVLRANELQIEEKVLGAGKVPVTQGLQDREIDMARLTPEQKEAHKTLLAAGFDIVVPPEGDMPNANEVHFADLSSGDILDRVMLADELTRQSHMDFTDENGEINLRRLRGDEVKLFEGDPGYSGVETGSWAMIPNDDSQPVPIAEPDVPEDTARDMAMDRVKDVGSITYKGKQHAIQDILDAADKFGPGKDESKFGSYVLPGGANYREILFTLPVQGQKFQALIHDKWQDFRTRDEAIAAGERAGIDIVSNPGFLREVSEQAPFRSSHFEQLNIFAHTRLTDRTINGKRVLFVEEIQSDWHQKGRREGYKGDLKPLTELPDLYRVSEPTAENKNFIVEGPNPNIRGDQYNAVWGDGATREEAISAALEEINNQREAEARGAVPDAPFRKTWHEYVIKRLLRMAAEEGYDSIAWTTGDQQADRYDLSKQVDQVSYKKNDDGTYQINALPVNRGSVQNLGAIPGDRLVDVVGKDLADKIVAGEGEQSGPKDEWRRFTGVDLKVGGEGMRGFYDKIVPQFLEKFTKKYGAKIEDAEMRHPDEDVSDPGFETVEVHNLDLTPQLRDAALQQGFELFQAAPGEGPRGRVRFGPESGNPRFTIELLQKADRSTFLHESGHVFLEEMGRDAATIAALSERTAVQEQLVKDWATVQTWLGAKEGAALTREQHEQWARGFEAYVMEGKAPSASLRAAFRRFKAWLLKIYKDITDLKVELSPDVRGVFDRLLATQQEIAEAQADIQRAPLFSDPATAGMDTKAMEGYMKAVDEAKAAAEEDLAAKMLEKVRREETAAYKAERATVKAEVANAIDALPVYQAIAALQAPVDPDSEPFKLDRAAVLEIAGADAVAKMPRGIFGPDGLHPRVVADMMQYDSAEAMLAAIAEAPPRAQAIETMTEQRMAERHGDLMTNIEAMQDEAVKAVHNDKHAEVLRSEIKHLASDNFAAFKGLAKKITGRVPSSEAMRIEAARAIGRRKVRDLRPGLFKVAEAKSAREARDLFLAGDIQGAFDAKRRELGNHELYRAATEAKDAQDRAFEHFKRLQRPDEKLAPRRDIDLINAARAILAQFHLDRTDKPAVEYLAQLQAFDPEMFETVNEIVAAATKTAGDWREMSVDEFSAMAETVDSLWDLSLRTQQIEIEGRRMDKQDAIDDLTRQLNAFETPKELAGYKRALTTWDKAKIQLMGARAALRRVESWVDAIDLKDPAGDFRKYIWNPISDATNNYRIEKRDALKKYVEIIDKLKGTLHTGEIIAPELGYTFKDKAEMLHSLLHTGNESNATKLLRGRGWGEYDATGELDTSRWRAFEQRMQKEGRLTKADYDFAQSVWDLLESMKPAAQKAHKDMYGYYFGEVQATPINTPWGVYAGGYVPAITDPWIVREADIRAEKEAIEKSNNSFMFPTAGRGFTKKRVERYAKPLLLDLGLLAGHIDKVLRFTHIEPRVKDVGRIVMDRGFRAQLDAVDPAVGGDMLVPWLQRAAQQKIETASAGLAGRALDNFFRELRRRTGLQIMTANVVNTIQQFTGISIGAVKVKPQHLRNALWEYARSPLTTSDAIAEKSKFMATRTTSQVFEIQQQLNELLVDPSKFEEARAFAQKHGYILQAGAQNIVDNIVWTGAYDQAVTAGAAEKDAVRQADSAVRATQGSFNPEDISRFETGSPFTRAFTMFYSYFNMQANLLGTEFSAAMRQQGLKKGAGRALYVYAMGFMIPAVLSELIVRSMSGKFDEDDDDQVLDDFMAAFFFGQFRAATAMFPGGQAIQAGVNMFNKKWYDDRITTSPAVSMVESAVAAPSSVYKAIVEDGNKKKAMRDTLSLFGLLSGLPLVPISRPLGYLMDLREGKVQPATGPVDFTRGLLTGRGERQ